MAEAAPGGDADHGERLEADSRTPAAPARRGGDAGSARASVYPCWVGPWWLHVLIMGALIAGTCLLYLPAVSSGYLTLDDADYVTRNPLLQRLDGGSLWRMLSEPYFANYSPTHLLSYAIDRAVGGFDPRVFHLSNHLWAGLAAAGVYLVALCLFGRPEAGVLAGVLFAVHPVHVEAVAWISSRKDLVAAAFALPAFAAYILGRRQPRHRLLWSGVSVCLFVAAIAGKQSVVVLPAIMVAFDVLVERRRGLGFLLEKIPFAAAAAFFALRTMGAQPETGHGLELVRIGQSVLQDLWLLTGVPEYVIYRLPPAVTTGRIVVDVLLASVPFLLALAPLALLAVVSGRATALLYWVIFALAPPQVLGFVHPVSDRYMFFPSVGVALLAAHGFVVLRQRQRTLALAYAGVVAAVAAFWSWQTLRYVGEWPDPRSLWYHALRKSEDPLVFQYAGSHYMSMSEELLVLQKAGKQTVPRPGIVRLAQAVWAGDTRLPTLLAGWAKGEVRGEPTVQFQKALDDFTWNCFEEALRRRGQRLMPNLFFRRGKFKADHGDYVGGRAEFLQVLEQAASVRFVAQRQELEVRCQHALGVIAWRQGDYVEALRLFRLALAQQEAAGRPWIPDLAGQCTRLEARSRRP